jgi:hypothetical protein
LKKRTLDWNEKLVSPYDQQVMDPQRNDDIRLQLRQQREHEAPQIEQHQQQQQQTQQQSHEKPQKID